MAKDERVVVLNHWQISNLLLGDAVECNHIGENCLKNIRQMSKNKFIQKYVWNKKNE
jgi:hypothetical protein